MSSDELKAELGDLVHPLPSRRDFGPRYYCDLVAEPYVICGEDFCVFLQMDMVNEGLERVLVEMADTTSTFARRTLVAEVEELLTGEHGPLTDSLTDDDDGMLIVDRNWTGRTYDVELKYMFVDVLKSSDLFVIYEPTDEDVE